MVRIGEGGAAYQLPGWDYSSEIAVTTPAAVRAMLRSFLAVAGTPARTSSSAPGAWASARSATCTPAVPPTSEVLGRPRRRRTSSCPPSTPSATSTATCRSTTRCSTGDQRRIVEFQSRREFEGFGALPNDLGVLHQLALHRFLAANPHIEGVWTWAQGGGPLLAGPRTLHLRAGFWQLYDLNSYVTGAARVGPGPRPRARRPPTGRAARSPTTRPPWRRICQAMALSRRGGDHGALHRTVRGQHGAGARARAAADDVDLRVGHRHRRQRRARHDLRGEPRPDRRGRRARAPARSATRRGCGTWWRPRTRRRGGTRCCASGSSDTLDYQVDLFGTLARVPDHRPAARAVARHRLDGGRRRVARGGGRVRDGPRRARPPLRRTTWTCRRTTSPPRTSGSSGPTRDAPMAWLAADPARGSGARPVVGRGRGGRRTPLRALWTGATRPWRLGRPRRRAVPAGPRARVGGARRWRWWRAGRSSPRSPRRRTWWRCWARGCCSRWPLRLLGARRPLPAVRRDRRARAAADRAAAGGARRCAGRATTGSGSGPSRPPARCT